MWVSSAGCGFCITEIIFSPHRPKKRPFLMMLRLEMRPEETKIKNSSFSVAEGQQYAAAPEGDPEESLGIKRAQTTGRSDEGQNKSSPNNPADTQFSLFMAAAGCDQTDELSQLRYLTPAEQTSTAQR